MAKRISATGFEPTPPTKRPGIHAKTKNSKSKRSKHYKKTYRGQGK